MIPWPVLGVAIRGFLGKYWKYLLLGGALIAGAWWLKSTVYNSGYDAASRDVREYYEQREEDLNLIWTDRVLNTAQDRDQYWTAQLEVERERVATALSLNKAIRDRQEDLRKQLALTSEQLAALKQEYENADFGTAVFTSDADRLLIDAHRAAFGDSTATPDGEN